MDVIRAVGSSVALSGGVLIILAVAPRFTNCLITANVPAQLSEWTQANVHSKWVFLLGLNAVLIPEMTSFMWRQNSQRPGIMRATATLRWPA